MDDARTIAMNARGAIVLLFRRNDAAA